MESAGKKYKVTYKAYYNERLKKSLFHNKLIHPLYIQLVFDRTPITFKSYYFNLFSKSKYAIQTEGKIVAPKLNEIVKREKSLIDFIIEKNHQRFSMDIFKKDYAFYCRDLIDTIETDFSDYLNLFLHDEGLPTFAYVIHKGIPGSIPYNFAIDMKRALNLTLYKKFIKNSFDDAPPYLLLYHFADKIKRTHPICISVLEWEQGIKEEFTAFFKKHYPDKNIDNVLKKINSVELS